MPIKPVAARVSVYAAVGGLCSAAVFIASCAFILLSDRDGPANLLAFASLMAMLALMVVAVVAENMARFEARRGRGFDVIVSGRGPDDGVRRE